MPTIKKLHPTLKACKCGMIGTKTQLYHHFSTMMISFQFADQFYAKHGEVPLNEDDPRTRVGEQLKESLK